MRLTVWFIRSILRSASSFLFGLIFGFVLLKTYSNRNQIREITCDQPMLPPQFALFTPINMKFKSKVLQHTDVIRSSDIHKTNKARTPKDELTSNQTIVFIEGLPRSGTTLMRVLLDTDPAIYCGPESSFLPNMFSYFGSTLKAMSANEQDAAFFREADLDREHVLGGMRGLLLGYLGRRSKDKQVLCDKHVALMEYGEEIVRLLPHIKFIFMIRDIRAKVDHFWQGK